ncbi:MAG: ABC transporter permease [Nonlabens sp.]
MFKNYIKLAFRNLKKSKFLTIINVLGLAVGMAGSLLIAFYVFDELGHDQMFKDIDQLYRVDTDIKFGGAAMKASQTSAPMAAAMLKDFAEVKEVTRLRDQGEQLARDSKTTDNLKSSDATYADANVFTMLGLELSAGNTETALEKANTVVISESVAAAHYGKENPVGQSFIIGNDQTFLITGVIPDLPKNSFLRNHGIFMSMEGYPPSKMNLWGSMNYYTYVKLREGSDVQEFSNKVAGMLETYMLPWVQSVMPAMTPESFQASGDYIRYYVAPVSEVYLHSDRDSEMSETSSIQNIYILSFIGIFLIFLACVNFMNLATAHSLQRAKEVGIRKTLGSNKLELVWQFLTESGLIAVFSMIVALLLCIATLPAFNDLADKEISFPYDNLMFWLLVLGATLLLGLLSGSYPAFFLSRFKPVDTLKGEGTGNAGGGGIRNVLVIFQFAIAVVLIIGTLVVYQQLDFIQSKDLGYSKEQVLLVDNAFSAGKRLDAFKDEVESLGMVSSATLSSQMPTPSDRSNTTFLPEGQSDISNALQMQEWSVDEFYIKTIGLELIAGRDFDASITTDKNAVILNEANAANMGFTPQEAIGKRFVEMAEEDEIITYTVIGVVKDFHYANMRENIGAVALFNSRSTGMMAIKLQGGDITYSIDQIERLWNKHAAGQPFDYSFMDDDFNETYSADQRLGSVFIVFTSLSIFIACLGLFGLATLNAQKRRREIGVRKVLGASVGQITLKLTYDFLKLVGVATLIALPLGWYAMNTWLQDFSYRIDIEWSIFMMAIALVSIVAITTVGFQSIKAALANPVKSLRSE